ncbi:hypothetical protein NZK32_04105 [Cyanobium sp. FGCU-52]|nr:hypothetical protein [Cyanobium sp. FGCU52]
MKVLNGYDVFEGRLLELRHGDFFDDKLQLDVLVISAWDGFYEPQDGTMIKALKDQCSITVKDLRRALDFSKIPTIRAWISEDLTSKEAPVRWKQDRSRFKRLVVIESPRIDSTTAPQPPLEEGIPVFQQMFRMLALLKLHGIDCHTVATPLLNTGRQGAELQPLIAGLLRSMRMGFENVPELRNLVIFDLKEEAIEELKTAINEHLRRPEIQTEVITLDDLGFDPKPLKEQLEGLLKRQTLKGSGPDLRATIGDIIQQLDSGKLQLAALGIAARKLVEVLVTIKTSESVPHADNLFKRINYLESSISAWIANGLHGVRIFGNWVAHVNVQEVGEVVLVPSRPVRPDDLAIMLRQLHCVLESYPWLPGKKVIPKPKRLLKERKDALT